MNPEDYRGRGELPDALAFVLPNRSKFWLELAEHGEAMTAGELEDELGFSSATVYRMCEELEDLGLVERSARLTDGGPKRAFRAVDVPPEAPPIWERQPATEVDS